MQVALIGSTGEVGRYVRSGLLEHPQVTGVLSISRSILESEDPRLQQECWDFEAMENWPRQSVDVAICCLGTTIQKAGSQEAFTRVDRDYVLGFAKWAKANGAKEFHVVSALGADKDSKVFYNRVKGQMEEALTQLKFNGLRIYRPSLLDSERKERRFWERVAILLMRRVNPLLRGRFRNFRSIHVSDVAAGILRRIGSSSGREVIPSHEI